MQRLKRLFIAIRRSISDTSYYEEVLNGKRFWYSLRYLYGLLVCTALLAGLTFSAWVLTLVPRIPSFVVQISAVARAVYPPGLIVTVKNGQLSTNVQEPYVIEYPSQIGSWLHQRKPDDREANMPAHLVTIDTNAHIEDYRSKDSLILVTKRSVVYPDRQAGSFGYRVFQLDSMKRDKELRIDQKLYNALVDKLLPYLHRLTLIAFAAIAVALLVWPFVGASVALAGYLLYLLLLTTLVWIIAMIARRRLTYAALYRMGMPGATVPILYTLLERLLGFHIPMGATALFLVWMVIVIFNVQPPQPAAHVILHDAQSTKERKRPKSSLHARA